MFLERYDFLVKHVLGYDLQSEHDRILINWIRKNGCAFNKQLCKNDNIIKAVVSKKIKIKDCGIKKISE